MDTMKQLTVLAVLSLCCTSLTSGTGDCHPEGPEDCDIVPGEYSARNRTVCSWSLGSNFTFYKSSFRSYWFVGLTRNRQEGKLTSRTACSTRGVTHCLRFQYLFQQDNIIDLSVSIQYEGTDQAESPLWIMSSSYGWDRATVLINTDRSFTVVFKAKRRPDYISSSDSVFFDLISYRKSSCPSGLYPANAQPTTTTASTSITTTKSTTLAASTTPTTTTATTADTSADSKSNPPSTTTTLADSTPTMSTRTTFESDGDTSSRESNNVGIIVGVIVALLVVIVIVIAVLLVFRRKNILFLKICCRTKQSKEQFHMNASHNVAYSRGADDSDHVNDVVTNHTQQNSENHRLEARASTYSSTNHSYENTPTNDPSEPVYAAVNKPQKVSQETPPQSQSKPNSTVYEMFNEEAANCYDAAGKEYQNLPPTMGKQEQDGQNNSSSPLPTRLGSYNLTHAQNSSSVYHILENEPGTDSNSVHHVPNASVTTTALGQDGEYNKLDFDRKDRGETNSFDQEKTERATGGVYSHLNEGDGDTYNEVHREKRDEVIDGVYSHIK